MPEYMYACDVECLSEGAGLVPFGGESEWVAKNFPFWYLTPSMLD